MSSEKTEIATLTQRVNKAEALNEQAWTIIANKGGGNWTGESADWQAAAARWRDEWIASGPPLPMGSAQATLDKIAIELKAIESTATEPNAYGEAVRNITGRLRGILAVTVMLALLAIPSSAWAQHNVGDYCDDPANNCTFVDPQDEAEAIQLWKDVTGCPTTPSEFYSEDFTPGVVEGSVFVYESSSKLVESTVSCDQWVENHAPSACPGCYGYSLFCTRCAMVVLTCSPLYGCEIDVTQVTGFGSPDGRVCYTGGFSYPN